LTNYTKESCSMVLGDLDLVAKKNSGSDRPVGSGDQGNQIPKDVILTENDRPCADVVGKTNLNDFRGTSLSPKVLDESEEDLQPPRKNAKIAGSNSRSELLGSREGDRLQAFQIPQPCPLEHDFDSGDGLFNPPNKADEVKSTSVNQGSNSGSGLLGSGGNDRLQALQIPLALPMERDLNSGDGLVNPPSKVDEVISSTSVLSGSGNGFPRSGLPSLMASSLLSAGSGPENTSSNSIPLSGILRASLSDEANANRQSGLSTRSQVPGTVGLGSSTTAASKGNDSPSSGVSTSMGDNILLQTGIISSISLNNLPTPHVMSDDMQKTHVVLSDAGGNHPRSGGHTAGTSVGLEPLTKNVVPSQYMSNLGETLPVLG
jgi:hypothetical protein